VITNSAARALEARLPAGRLLRDVPLAPCTTFRIGGPADFFFEPETEGELIAALRAARELEIPFFLLGSGANILIGDKGFRGIVIRNRVAGIEFLEEEPGENPALHGARASYASTGNRQTTGDQREMPSGDRLVRAGAGTPIFHDLIQATVSRGLGGLHHFVGIPSTVGGAIWQNLHFLSPPPERERTVFIEEVVERALILSSDNEVLDVPREYFRFGYDYSILHDRADIVLNVTFRLTPTPEEELRATIRENLQWRDDRHPDLWLYPSAGSVFQKIEGVGAGRLIDECGLKGHVLGNARIFPKHANIIVNLGGATAQNVRELIDLARNTVSRELGYDLHPEIGFIGEF
jgi:UDP-N-acetylmuramate dehydrogenase